MSSITQIDILVNISYVDYIGLQLSLPSHASASSSLQTTSTQSILISNKNTIDISTPSIFGNEFIRGLVSGAVSRASKEIILHPFDTIRARQQVPQNTNNITSTSGKSGGAASQDIFKDLYAGLVPALIGGIPAG